MLRGSAESLLIFLLITLNLIFHGTVLAVIVCIPQFFIIIIYLLSSKNNDRTIYYHFLFTFSCLAIPYLQLLGVSGDDAALYNYSRLKVAGPISASQVLLVLIILKGIYLRNTIKITTDMKPIFYMLVYFLISSFVIGILGFMVDDYRVNNFITYFIYLFILVLYCICLLSVKNKRDIFRLFEKLIVLSPIASVAVYVFGFSAVYGNSAIPGMIEVAYFAPIILIKMCNERRVSLLGIISLLSSVFLLSTGAPGGKGLAVFLFIFLAAFFSFMRIRDVIYLVCFGMLFLLITPNISQSDVSDYSGLLLYKVESFYLLIESLFNFNLIKYLPLSPKIRIYEIILIWESGMKNVFYFLFGHGYGGYYIDELNLFSGMDLSTAFSNYERTADKYYSSHDFFTVIPFLHGAVGSLIYVLVSMKYFFQSSVSYLYISIVPLFLSFYFNNQFGSFGVLCILLASQHREFKNAK